MWKKTCLRCGIWKIKNPAKKIGMEDFEIGEFFEASRSFLQTYLPSFEQFWALYIFSIIVSLIIFGIILLSIIVYNSSTKSCNKAMNNLVIAENHNHSWKDRLNIICISPTNIVCDQFIDQIANDDGDFAVRISNDMDFYVNTILERYIGKDIRNLQQKQIFENEIRESKIKIGDLESKLAETEKKYRKQIDTQIREYQFKISELERQIEKLNCNYLPQLTK